jgi:hypothetical protein
VLAIYSILRQPHGGPWSYHRPSSLIKRFGRIHIEPKANLTINYAGWYGLLCEEAAQETERRRDASSNAKRAVPARAQSPKRLLLVKAGGSS